MRLQYTNCTMLQPLQCHEDALFERLKFEVKFNMYCRSVVSCYVLRVDGEAIRLLTYLCTDQSLAPDPCLNTQSQTLRLSLSLQHFFLRLILRLISTVATVSIHYSR